LIFLLNVIRKVNVHVIQALSGPEALAKTKEMDLALAIIDVRMPGMNGYELAIKINEERSGFKVPIIFLTASHVNEMQVFEGYGSGAVDYIFKPVNNHILLSKINVFLDLFSQRQTIIRDGELLKRSSEALIMVNDALKKGEEKYRSYINHAPDGVFVANETGKCIEVNEAACRITGYSKEELLKMTVSDLMPDESAQDGLTYFRKAIKTGASQGNLLFRQKGGNKRWWSIEFFRLNETRFLGFAKDITQRLQLEESLRVYQIELEMQNDELKLTIDKAQIASRKYSELYDFAPSGYFTLTEDKTIQELNHSGARILGKGRLSLLGSHFGLFVSKNFLTVFNTFFQSVYKSNVKEFCEVILESDGSKPKYVYMEGVVIGNTKQCLLNVVDVSDRKVAELAMKISEGKYRTMLNASPDGIFILDLNGIIIDVSEIGIELSGFRNKNELIGVHFSRFVLPGNKNKIREIINRTINEGIAQNFELSLRNRSRYVFLSETSSTLIQNPVGTPLSFMIIIRDISHRKKLEAKQIHAGRMASLGEMAAGIAHEINQPLNIISMVMDKILFETAKTDTIDVTFLKNKSNKIFENIIRIRNIIDHIRAFSRSQDDYILAAFDINATIENAVSMIAEQLKHLGIRLILELESKIPQVFGNPHRFEQVMINLLVNAKDAVIEKKSKQDQYLEMIIRIRSYSENQSVIVEVSDNGIGIRNDDINNIMLPFYTTKEVGEGTGLGLSISYQIIKEMNGSIDITSDKIGGTKVRLVIDTKKKKLQPTNNLQHTTENP